MTNHTPDEKRTSGIDTLIQQLRVEGVDSGRKEAAKVVSEAESRAGWILKQAQEEADQILLKAKQEADQLVAASKDALQVAARDTILTLKEQLTRRFTGEVQRLVSQEMNGDELLKKLILVIAGRLREHVEETQELQILLPADKFSQEGANGSRKELEHGPLTHFIRLLNRDMLRKGVEFGVAEDNLGGMRICIKEDNVVLDMSDKALAQELLQHMMPRLRALLEGMVK